MRGDSAASVLGFNVTYSATESPHTRGPDLVATLSSLLHQAYEEADLGNLPDPVDELVYIGLSRQTHAKNAAQSWDAVAGLGGYRKIVDMDGAELAEALRPGGLSNQKARWIQDSLRRIRDEFGQLSLDDARGWSDSDLEAFLCSLPGISIKSAKCIMLYSMHRNVLPVDTHVRRIAERIGLVDTGLSEKEIHVQLEALIAPKYRRSFHINSVWHGRIVCKALGPSCDTCQLAAYCGFGQSWTLRGGGTP